MTLFAKRLVVASVPEQFHIAFVVDDMVDDFGAFDYVLFFAFDAEGILHKILGSVLTPSMVIATLSGAVPVAIKLGGILPALCLMAVAKT